MANQKQYPTFIEFRKGEEGKAPFGAVIANVTRDIELRYTPSGKAVANTAIAVNLGAKHINYILGTSYNDADTVFIEITGWEQTAENMSKANITKGSQVAFTGTLAIEEYNDKKRVRMNASRFQILKRKGDAVKNQGVSQDTSNGEPIDIDSDDLPF